MDQLFKTSLIINNLLAKSERKKVKTQFKKSEYRWYNLWVNYGRRTYLVSAFRDETLFFCDARGR